MPEIRIFVEEEIDKHQIQQSPMTEILFEFLQTYNDQPFHTMDFNFEHWLKFLEILLRKCGGNEKLRGYYFENLPQDLMVDGKDGKMEMQ